MKKNPQSLTAFGGRLTRNPVRLAAVLAVLASASLSQAGLFVKTNNATALNVADSWTNNAVPGAADIAQWDATVSDVNNTTNAIGANLSLAGIKILNPAGSITITTNTGVATLTLGASGIDMASATADLTLSNGVALLAASAQTWSAGSGRLLTLAGILTRAATGNSATLNFDTSLGGTLNIASGTASALLLSGNCPFATFNYTDYAALDASRNVVVGVTFYGDYTLGGNLSGTYGSPILNITGTATGSTQAWRNSNTFIVPNGVRFNVANTQNTRWTVDTSSSGRVLTTGAILIGPGVGAQNVEFNGSGGIRANGNSQDLVLHQNNPAGDLIINTTVNIGASSTATPLVKTGAGRVILNNTGNGYTGATRVEAGTLMVNGVTSTGALTVNSGATLAGAGSIRGATTMASAGIIIPGNTTGAGVLTMSALTLEAGSQLKFYPGTPTTNTTALLNLTNNLTIGGAVDVFILSPTVSVGQYPLVKWTNAISGTFNLVAIKPHVGAYLSNNTATASIDLVVTNVAQPLTWATGSGTWQTNGSSIWDAPGIGSTTYQETAGLGDAVLFEDTLSGGSPITVTLNSVLVPSSTTINNITKTYTISGSGAIAGNGSLTKAGSGTLTLGTANTFTGGLNLNSGTTVFSALNNLGAGAISFGGGTLQFASGNTDDISVRPVTFGAGGATINDGGNAITFANAVGNNGSGGLTKLGSGSLTLSSTNRYAGNTVISSGSLALGSGISSISNSAVIVVGSGAFFDLASVGDLALNGVVNQKLAGNGTVVGGVTLASGASISPLTNGSVGTLTFSNGNLTLSGGTLMMDISAAARDRIAITNGGLTINSGTLVLNVTGTLPYGVYTLITYPAGSLTGSAGTLSVSGFAQAGAVATLSEAVAGEIQLVVVASASDVIKWAGVGADWDLIGTANWYLGGSTPWAYTNGDFVTFDEVGAGNPAVYLKAAVSPASVTVNNSATSYSFEDGSGTGSGRISGTATLTKLGSGGLTVNTVNDTAGNVVVNGGTLQVNGHLGTGHITNHAELILGQTTDRTISGSVTGSGNLTRSGSGNVTVSGAANYTGNTIITAGTLQFGTGGPAGALSTAAITNDGTLVLNSSTSWTYNMPDTGTGNLTKQGSNTLTMSGANSRTGQTRVDAGKIILGQANHLQGSARVEAGGTLDMNGYDQVVLGLQSTLSGGGLIVNNAGTATNLLTVSNTATAYDCSAAVQGSIALAKKGEAMLTWRGNSTYTGGTTIEEGTIRNVSGTAFGTGPVDMTGGAIEFTTSSTFTNIVNLLPTVGGRTNTFYPTGNVFWPAPMVGTNDLVINWGAGNVTFSMNGGAAKWAGVTNTTYLRSTASGWLRMDSGSDARNVTFDLTDSFVTLNNNGTPAIHLGALIGNTNTAAIYGGGGSFTIGYKNLSTTFAGRLGGGATSLTKVGTGTLTLTGTNQFTSALTISNGTLALTYDADPASMSAVRVVSAALLDVSGLANHIIETNELGEVTNDVHVAHSTLSVGTATVAQTVSGGGTLRGNLIVGTNGVVNPGDGIGMLTVTTNLTLGGTLIMELNRTNSPATNDMLVASTITGGGTLTVANLGAPLLAGDTFKLFNQPVSGFTTINLPQTFVQSGATNNYTWLNNLAVDGTIQVTVGYNPINTNPPVLISSLSGSTLTLSWPTNAGWTLLEQTNSLTTGLSTNWVAVPGSENITTTNITVDPNKPSVFYQLRYIAP